MYLNNIRHYIKVQQQMNQVPARPQIELVQLQNMLPPSLYRISQQQLDLISDNFQRLLLPFQQLTKLLYLMSTNQCQSLQRIGKTPKQVKKSTVDFTKRIADCKMMNRYIVREVLRIIDDMRRSEQIRRRVDERDALEDRIVKIKDSLKGIIDKMYEIKVNTYQQPEIQDDTYGYLPDLKALDTGVTALFHQTLTIKKQASLTCQALEYFSTKSE